MLGEFGVSQPLVNTQILKNNISYHIHALDVLTLEERPGFPALISGPADNASHLPPPPPAISLTMKLTPLSDEGP